MTQVSKQFKQLSTLIAGTVALTLGTITSAQASSFVSFEDASEVGLGDNQKVIDQYLNQGFSFGMDNDLDGLADLNIAPVLEKVGNDNTSGFVNAGSGNDVAEAGLFDEDLGITYADRLGNYFLRTGGLGGNGGNLLITYTEGTSAASGELWDIDGNANFFNDGSNRIERWEVQALGADGSILEKILSPEGTVADGPLDGKPWLWSFERDTADVKAIRFVFTGDSPAKNVGLAFDNFSAYGVEGAETPEPGSLAGLMVLGLVGGQKVLSKRKARIS